VAEACDEARECIERVVLIANFWTRHRDTPFNKRQLRALQIALAENDPGESYLTAKRVARWTKHERVTASRDLAQLEQWGVIRKDPTVGGRSTRYFVRLDAPDPKPLVENIDWN
jgi:Fic family protein